MNWIKWIAVIFVLAWPWIPLAAMGFPVGGVRLAVVYDLIVCITLLDICP